MLYQWDENTIKYSVSKQVFPGQEGRGITLYENVSNRILYYRYISNSENLENYINTSGEFDFSSGTLGYLDVELNERRHLPTNTYAIIGLTSDIKTSGVAYTSINSNYRLYGDRPKIGYNLYNWGLTSGGNSGAAYVGRTCTPVPGAGNFVQNVYSTNSDQYPNNDKLNGYWYDKIPSVKQTKMNNKKKGVRLWHNF